MNGAGNADETDQGSITISNPTVRPVSQSLRQTLQRALEPQNLHRDFARLMAVKESERPLSNMGFDLIKFFGWMLCFYLIVSALLVFWSEWSYTHKLDQLTSGLNLQDYLAQGTNAPSDIKVEQLTGVTKAVSEAYKESRDNLIEFLKTIISSIIFPILTALLGYTFAQKQIQKDNNSFS